MITQVSCHTLILGAACLLLCTNLAHSFSTHVASATFSRGMLSSRPYRTSLSERMEVTVEKPLGIVLEENEENMAQGVFCADCGEDSSGFAAGIRSGDVIMEVDGTETSDFTFEQVMGLLQSAESPVAMTLERKPPGEEEEKKAVRAPAKISPKRMPSAKKLAKASTSAALWKDPLMIASAAFTVIFPLGIYLASKIGKS